MSCLQCKCRDVYVVNEYSDKEVYIVTFQCESCNAVYEEHYKLETRQIVTKGNK